MSSNHARSDAGRTPRARGGRPFEVGLSLYGAVVFGALWIGFAVGVATGGAILEDAWAWLTGLEAVAAVMAWILLLPIAVGLWAWNEAGSVRVQGVVLLGLVAWTLLMVGGLAKTVWRPSR
jgi:hypothetical protein